MRISTPIRYGLVAIAALACAAPAVAAHPNATTCASPLAEATAAVAIRRTTAYRAPGVRPFARFRLLNANDYPTVFGVVGSHRGAACWLRVQLPLRPNGLTGWVRQRDVTLVHVKTQIEVDVSARRLVLREDGRVVLRTRTAVGASATPTPLGRFYVNQRLIPYDKRGAYGPAALGVSAFSPVLRHWAQGGPIGIHGTDEPWSIGHAASNGCIRVPNGVMGRLFRLVPAGTPVVIHA